MSRDVIMVGSTMQISLLYRDRKAKILYEYETFKANEGEQLLDTYLRYLQVVNDLKKCCYKKDNCELNYKFLNNLQPEWKQYGTLMRQTKNLMDINIDSLYIDPLALVAEKTKVSKRKEKVVVSSDSEGSEFVKSNEKKVDKKADEKKRDMSEVKYYNCKKEGHFAKNCKKAKIKDYNYYKTKMLLAKKDSDEQVLLDEDQAWMESKSDESSSSAKETIAEIADQEVLFDKMIVELVELDKHVRDLKKTVLEKDFKISELEEYVCNKDLEIEKCLECLNVYGNKLQKIGQTNQTVHMIMPSKDNLYNGQKGIGFENPSYFEKAKELRPTLYDEKAIGLGYTLIFLTHSDEALEIKKFKRSRENKIEFAYDYENLNASYVKEKINFSDDYFQEIINPDFEKINSPFQQTSSLKPYVPNVILEKIIIDLEDEVVRLLEKEKANLKTIESLKSKGFESSENAIFESENQSQNDCLVVEKECDKVENRKVIAPGMFKLSVSQSVSSISVTKTSCDSKSVENKTKRKRRKRKSSKQNDKQGNNDVLRANRDFFHFSNLDTFSSVRRPKHSGVIWKKKGSSNTFNVDLSSVSFSKLKKNVKRYSRKDLLSCNNFHLRETSSASMCNDAMNVSCNYRMCDVFDDNNFFIFDDESVRISPVSKMPFTKKPRDSMNMRSKTGIGGQRHVGSVSEFLGTVRFDNNDFAVIAGYGDVVIGSMTIKKVHSSTCFVRNEDGVDLLTGDRSSNLYTLALNEVASNSSTYLLAKASSSQSWLWHQRLSHLNFSTINNLVKNNLVQGLPKMKFEKDHLCSTCEQGKIHRKPHKSKTDFASNKPLYLLYMDLCGQMRVESINGKAICRVRINNGTEFKNKNVAKFFDKVGITQQFSAARTPQQNGVVERRNRTLVEAARTMLTFTNLPSFLWAKSITTACFTQNCSIIHKRFDKTPYELMNKRKPNSKFFRVFRCGCYLLNDYEDVGKLKEKGHIGVFVGYSKESVAFRIYNKRTRKIHESVNANVHTFYQPYPHEKKWTKDHPLHKIIGDPKLSVRISGQLANKCLFSCLLSSIEPANVAEALKEADWEEVYVGQPLGFVSKQYPDHVYALDKALYGLKQAPRAWYDVLLQFLIDNGFQKVPTPMVKQAKLKLDLVGKPVDHTDYRSMIGSLMYVTSSGLDIMFATCLWYPKDSGFDLTAYSDADHAGCHLDRKSTSGSVQFLVLWMRTQLTDYGFFYDKVPIYCDSKSAIAISCNPVQHTRTKHIDVRTKIDLPKSLPSNLGKLGLGLPNDIYSLIDSNETAKDLWDALERQMRGSEYGEQDRKVVILYEYETFKAHEGEQLLDTYLRYLQVINDLKKYGYKKDKCELNYKFLNNFQQEWKQYATLMMQTKNLMDININALYNILKQNQGDVNDAMGSKKKIVVVTSDPLALIVEKTNVRKRKEKVVVSLDFKGSEVDDFSELKKITALLAKAFNRRKFYSKPT
nr:hypothetical protein [Tanacetum cinerariifolium]